MADLQITTYMDVSPLFSKTLLYNSETARTVYTYQSFVKEIDLHCPHNSPKKSALNKSIFVFISTTKNMIQVRIFILYS